MKEDFLIEMETQLQKLRSYNKDFVKIQSILSDIRKFLNKEDSQITMQSIFGMEAIFHRFIV